ARKASRARPADRRVAAAYTRAYRGRCLALKHRGSASQVLRATVTTDAARLDLSRFLRPGDRIVWGHACGEPTTLIETLIAQAQTIGPLAAFAATSFSGVLDAAAADRIAISSMGAIGSLRDLAQAHRLAIVPCHGSQVAPMIEQGLIGCDVALVQVSPPDADGNHSYGLVGDFIAAAVKKASVVIAEVNERVPFTLGD